MTSAFRSLVALAVQGTGGTVEGKWTELNVLDTQDQLVRTIHVEGAAPSAQDDGASGSVVVTGLPEGAYRFRLVDYSWATATRTFPEDIARQLFVYRMQ